MFVDFDLAQGTAGSIKGIRQVGGVAAAATGCQAGILRWAAIFALRPCHLRLLSWQALVSPSQPAAPPVTPPPTHPSHPMRPCRAFLPATLQWITNEYLHCGIREAGVHIFEKLLNMARGGILLR
jgi:hypothetical protein